MVAGEAKRFTGASVPIPPIAARQSTFTLGWLKTLVPEASRTQGFLQEKDQQRKDGGHRFFKGREARRCVQMGRMGHDTEKGCWQILREKSPHGEPEDAPCPGVGTDGQQYRRRESHTLHRLGGRGTGSSELGSPGRAETASHRTRPRSSDLRLLLGLRGRVRWTPQVCSSASAAEPAPWGPSPPHPP